MLNKIILASQSKVRKEILDTNNIPNKVEPSNVDEDIVKESLLKEKATPDIISKNLAELKANKVSLKKTDEIGTSNNKAVIENFPVHYEIARRASTTRETVTRVLSMLTKRGIIKRRGKNIEIIDFAVLQRTFRNLSDSDI